MAMATLLLATPQTASAQTPDTAAYRAANDTAAYRAANDPDAGPGGLTRGSGQRIATLALQWIRTARYSPDGSDLARGCNSAHFVSLMYKLAGVKTPDPPAANMAQFGSIVHAVPGTIVLDGVTRELSLPGGLPRIPDDPTDSPTAPATLDALRPGDRLIFQRTVLGELRPGQPVSTLVGLYVGKVGEIARGVILPDARRRRFVVRNLDDARVQETYKMALRGWFYRAPGANESVRTVRRIEPGRDDEGALRGGSRVRAVVVGIGGYANGGSPPVAAAVARETQDADRQARQLWTALRRAYGGAFDGARSTLLLSGGGSGGAGAGGSAAGRATRANIEAAVQIAAQEAGPDDIVIIYLGGLGRNNYFFGADMEPAALLTRESRGVPTLRLTGDELRESVATDTLLQIAERGGARTTLLLSDYSGAAGASAAKTTARKNVLILSAAAPGSAVLRRGSGGGGGGRFVPALLESLATMDTAKTAPTVQQVAADVLRRIAPQQIGALYGSDEARPVAMWPGGDGGGR